MAIALLARETRLTRWRTVRLQLPCRHAATLGAGRFAREIEVAARRDFAAASHLQRWGIPTLSRDGKTIYAIGVNRDGRFGVWAVPASGGEARQVVTIDDPALTVLTAWAGLSAGPDELYLTVSEYESDIWVAKLRY